MSLLRFIEMSPFSYCVRSEKQGGDHEKAGHTNHERERRPCLGDLTQLDGSDHDWFEGRGPRCVFLIFIDDATSRILYGEFVPVEDIQNLLRAAKAYLSLYGRPLAFYVDRDSVYKVNPHATVEEDLPPLGSPVLWNGSPVGLSLIHI